MNGDGLEQCDYEDDKLTLATSFVTAACCRSTLGRPNQTPLQRSSFYLAIESFFTATHNGKHLTIHSVVGPKSELDEGNECRILLPIRHREPFADWTMRILKAVN